MEDYHNSCAVLCTTIDCAHGYAHAYQQFLKKLTVGLDFGFVDLEKASDRIPRKAIRWAMRKSGVEEWLVSAVMSIYTGAKTVVRTVCGNSSGFEVKVGMHQGSALSLLLFVIVVEAISRMENVRSRCRRLQDGRVVYVAEVLVVIQYNVLVFVTSEYTRSVLV